MSRTDLEESDGGGIHGRFVFAATVAPNAFDRDGHVSVDVKTDGASCTPGDATTTPDGDGVLVDEDFACARATSSIEATLFFVTELGSGQHEDVARIATADASHEELLRAPHRTIMLELHRAKKTDAPRRPWSVLLAIAAVALIALVIRSRMRAA